MSGRPVLTSRSGHRRRRRLVRNIVKDDSGPSGDVDVGRLPEEAARPFKDWIDVMAWVEADEEKACSSEQRVALDSPRKDN